MLFVIGLFRIMKIYTWFRSHKVSRKKKRETKTKSLCHSGLKLISFSCPPSVFLALFFTLCGVLYYLLAWNRLIIRFFFVLFCTSFVLVLFIPFPWELSMNLIIRNWPIIFLREPGFHTVDSLRCLARPKSMVTNGSKKLAVLPRWP